MKSFYLGIDVSKGYSDFVIINKKKKIMLQNFQLDDTFDAHCRLHKVLSTFLTGHPKATLYAGMESTGGYENNWYNSLTRFQASLNIKTARLNPYAVVHNSKADLKRNKTDKISAQDVAEYLVAHPEKVTYQQHDQMASLRKQWGFIRMLTKQNAQLLNQLNSLLYTANPELLSFCQDGMPGWILKLLLKYPTAMQLGKARAKTLLKIPYVTKERAQLLIADAKRSVASSTDAVSAQLVSATSRQIKHLKKTIAEQTNLMAEQCDLPEVALLKTFIGISDASAIGLIIEIQSIARFKTSKKLASFWGIHPVYKISGDGSGGFKMSKQGRKEPRKILFNVAMTAIVYNPVIKELYEYHLENGKAKMDAIGICMHKIVRIIYGMLKNNTAFDPKIDQANRKRMIKGKATKNKTGKSRRFEGYDPAAPVSRRQRNKRVEQELSHSVNGTKRGIAAPVPIKVILAEILAKL
ncbi:MAG: IS110 family transposase [Patescibacteria group bacterium]|nr:IS110 family transposase [Patescibacteria group bacterium]